LRYTKTFQEP